MGLKLKTRGLATPEVLTKKNLLVMTVIVSDYTGFYERIYTVETKSMFLLKLRYQLKGYRVWAVPTLWMAGIWYKLTGKGIYRGRNISFEKYVRGTDQITFWQPWMNFR
jgi:hypothetical protein